MANIVLVVAAGASRELEIPTGGELLLEIISGINYNQNYSSSNGEGRFLDPVNQFFNMIGSNDMAVNILCFEQELIPFREELRACAKNGKSLDAFLNQNGRSDILKKFGKFAIAYYIIGYEAKIKNENLYGFRENWIRYFLEKHLQPVKKDLRDGRVKIKIITFNYDRAIEHFLYYFLRYTPNPEIPGFEPAKGTDESRSIVDRFAVIHVYSKLADLDWQNPGEETIRFGERNNDKGSLSAASSAIKLIAETGIGRVTEETKTQIKKVMAEAEKIYCLGFGFDEDNMRILFGNEVHQKRFRTTASCDATAINIDCAIRDKYQFISYHKLKCFQMMTNPGLFKIE